MYDYLIRKKVLSVLGAKFHIYNPAGQVIGYCKQKAFKLKEDIRIYTDESQTVELINIQARNIIDFSACYDVFDSQTKQLLGSWRRKGWSSLVRDKWEMLDSCGNVVGVLEEDCMGLAIVRRLLTNLVPQSYYLDCGGMRQATFKQRFNPFIFQIEVALEPQCQIPPYLTLAGGILLSAIEGRQN